MIPQWFFVGVIGIFGLIIGSFLNVVIYRLHTGRSLNDRSHCLSCGRNLSWYELFPVFSYLVLRGRCRSCNSFIPYRYALVELLTAGLFILAYGQFSSWLMFILISTVLSVLVVTLVYDLYHKIIPDELSLILALLALLITALQAWSSGDGVYLLKAFAAGLLPAVSLYALWHFSKGRAIGLGDAKLSFGLGVLIGTQKLFSFIVLSFWLGALAGVLLIWLSTKSRWWRIIGFKAHVNMKSELPFAPFLILAFVLVYFFNVDVQKCLETVLLALI